MHEKGVNKNFKSKVRLERKQTTIKTWKVVAEGGRARRGGGKAKLIKRDGSYAHGLYMITTFRIPDKTFMAATRLRSVGRHFNTQHD